MRSVEEYNYDVFGHEGDLFGQFPGVLRAGEKAPDGELIDAMTGEQVLLSDYWKTKPVVIEWGSYT